MPGLQGENVAAAAQGSPVKKSKLSLKFLQKKETKRALDFSEPQADEPKTAEPVEPEARWVCAVSVSLSVSLGGSDRVQHTASSPGLEEVLRSFTEVKVEIPWSYSPVFKMLFM